MLIFSQDDLYLFCAEIANFPPFTFVALLHRRRVVRRAFCVHKIEFELLETLINIAKSLAQGRGEFYLCRNQKFQILSLILGASLIFLELENIFFN